MIYIYVGYPRTGSTYFTKTVIQNNIRSIQCMNWKKVSYACFHFNDVEFKKNYTKILKALKNIKLEEKNFICNNFLSTLYLKNSIQRKTVLKRIKNLFSEVNHEIYLIMVTRKHSELIQSLYHQHRDYFLKLNEKNYNFEQLIRYKNSYNKEFFDTLHNERLHKLLQNIFDQSIIKKLKYEDLYSSEKSFVKTFKQIFKLKKIIYIEKKINKSIKIQNIIFSKNNLLLKINTKIENILIRFHFNFFKKINLHEKPFSNFIFKNIKTNIDPKLLKEIDKFFDI